MNHPWSLSFRYFIGTLVFLGLLAFLYYARQALEPLVIAAFIAYLINPAVMLLSRYTKFTRRAAVNLVYFTSLTLLIATPATLTPIFFDELKDVGQGLMTGLDQIVSMLAKPVDFAGTRFDLAQLAAGLTSFRATFISPMPDEAVQLLESTSRGAIWSLVIIVCVYLFLSEWHIIRKWMLSQAPLPYRHEVDELYLRVRAIWMAYLRGQILLMLIVGIVFTIAWTIIGLPGALVLGVIAGLFTLVPDVGPFFAVVLAMTVALLQGSRWIPLSNIWVMLIVLAVYLVLINIKNLWLRPFIMGRSVNMNEGLILVSILIATILSGILGALLVVPVLASGVIILDYLLKRITGQSPFPSKSILVQISPDESQITSTQSKRHPPKKLNRK
jgi:predicted PurR-regulated permease PerM